MKKEYQNIVIKMLRDFRIKNGISQRKLEGLLNLSHAQISRFESGVRSINYYSAGNILKLVNPSFIYDKHTLEYYEKLLEDCYISYFSFNDKKTKKLRAKINIISESIKNSLCKYKYELYTFIFDDFNDCELKNKINYFLSNINFLSNRDIAILYNYIGLICSNYREYDSAEKYYQLSLSMLNDSDVICGLVHYQLSKIYIMKTKFFKAYDSLNLAQKLFKKKNLKNNIKKVNINLSLVYLFSGNYEDSAKILEKMLIDDEKSNYSDIKLLVINNLLTCYIYNKDFKKAETLVKTVEGFDSKFLSINIYITILHLFYLNKDQNNFLKWYNKSISTNINSDIINFLKFDLIDNVKPEILEVLSKSILNNFHILTNKEEIILINEILYNSYLRCNDYIKANEKLNKLYKIERHTLGKL